MLKRLKLFAVLSVLSVSAMAQSMFGAFYPMQLTVAIQPTNASSRVALIGPTGSTYGRQLRIVNHSGQDIWLAFGDVTVTAVKSAAGGANGGTYMLNGTVEVFTPPTGTAYVAVIQASNGTSNVEISEGEGT